MEKNCKQVQVRGSDPLTTMVSFSSSDFHNILLKNLSHNFVKPTPIQKYILPNVISGRDLIASTPTGCGKTVS